MSSGAKRVRDKDGKQRALMEAATEVFAEQGFDAAVTKEIARRVASGAAQAGIGTMSEVIAAGDVRVLGPILEPRTDGVAYAALVVRPAASAGVAHSFLAHLRAPESQALFRKAGFLPLD